MPMMVLDEKQFENELEKFSNKKPIDVKVVDIERGRKIGNKEISNEQRKEVSNEAITNGNQSAIEKYGVSQSSVSAYKNGATSCATYNKPNSELVEHNNEVRESIASTARSKLLAALEEITPDKVSKAKIRDIAGIAKDMSVVARNMEPQQIGNINNNQVIVYRPKLRDEDEFDVIVVNE